MPKTRSGAHESGVFDSILLTTLALVFLSALIGIYVRRRSIDRCLKDLAGFHVTVERDRGEPVWGRAAPFPNGIELFYETAQIESPGIEKLSYIVFAAELGAVGAIHRFHDELTEENKERRRAEIEATYDPPLRRSLLRRFRNFLNTFQDAFTQTVGAIVTFAKKRPGAAAFAAGDKYVRDIAGTVIEAGGNAYEPILERYIGHRVVLELKRGDDSAEYHGILKEYSAGWIELLDCRTVDPRRFGLGHPEQLRLNANLDFTVRIEKGTDDGLGGDDPVPVVTVKVTNRGREPVFVERVEATNYVEEIDESIEPGRSFDIAMADLPAELFGAIDPMSLPSGAVLTVNAPRPDVPLPDVSILVRSQPEFDLWAPRVRAVVRHGAEPLD